MRDITVNLVEILDLINCSEDYGFSDDVLMSAFAEYTGWVTDDEIEKYSLTYLNKTMREQGYTESDYENAKENLKGWRKKYCKKREEQNARI